MAEWSDEHLFKPHASFDGGDLDCGNGLLLLIRRHIDPLDSGQFLEILSTDASVEEDLPSWCRLTGNALISQTRTGQVRSYLVRKGEGRPRLAEIPKPDHVVHVSMQNHIVKPASWKLPPMAVMSIGSWPRPTWLLRALHDYLAGRLSEVEFHQNADDAVRLAVAAQERAGVDVITDGEQRRDSYSSFVGSRIENCQLIPITDLLPYVSDPDHFAEELRALDVPAEEVRHPAVLGPIRRTKPLAVHELQCVQRFSSLPVKVALPGPYLLTRTMWMECIADRAYPDRESLSNDIVRILREELEDLMKNGAAMVQFDEPVLTEVVFSRPRAGRSFMCGALGEKREIAEELAFARRLLCSVMEGFPRERLALHICRGNWSRDESVALRGPYTSLMNLLQSIPIGTVFLEMATPRAGELEVLRDLPAEMYIGLGVVNQKLDQIESVEEIMVRAKAAIRLFGRERIYLNPDCGFATFADNPLASAELAEQKMSAIVLAARLLREE